MPTTSSSMANERLPGCFGKEYDSRDECVMCDMAQNCKGLCELVARRKEKTIDEAEEEAAPVLLLTPGPAAQNAISVLNCREGSARWYALCLLEKGWFLSEPLREVVQSLTGTKATSLNQLIPMLKRDGLLEEQSIEVAGRKRTVVKLKVFSKSVLSDADLPLECDEAAGI